MGRASAAAFLDAALGYNGEMLRRLARIGVDERAPMRESRYVVLANVAGLAGILSSAAYIPVMAVFGGWVPAVIVSLQIPLWALSLLFNARRATYLATTSLVLTGLLYFVGQSLLFGPDYGHHFFLLVMVTGAFLIYAPRYRRSRILTATVGALAFLGVVVGGRWMAVQVLGDGHLPPLPLEPEALPFVRVPTTFGVVVALGLLASTSSAQTRRAEAQAQREFQKSESLLRNILPGPIADRLKAGEQTIADRFSEVTVLFADIADFTPLSAKLPPDEIVGLLNQVFSAFDALTEAAGLEKIKTIGDAYMVAGGLPAPRTDHAEAVAALALKMLGAADAITGRQLRLRIGIHLGPVVAGVIGRRKFAYDLWGDTVNTAARMESHGVAGRIQVSETCYRRLAERFTFERRGTIDVKGKGPMEVWFLTGPGADTAPSSGQGGADSGSTAPGAVQEVGQSAARGSPAFRPAVSRERECRPLIEYLRGLERLVHKASHLRRGGP